MPNLITHYYLAKKVKEKLSKQALNIVQPYEKAYTLGAMGPDYMFPFRELGMKEKRLPNLMQHLRMYEVFVASTDYIKKTGDEIVYAYLLGLLCHYVADYIIHPYVNYFVEHDTAKYLPINQVSNIHTLIESAIDSHICEEKYKIASNKFAADKVAVAPRKIRMQISRFYAKTIGRIFGYHTRAKRYNFAFLATKKFMKFSIDKQGWKKKIVDKIENILGKRKIVTGLIHPPYGYKKLDYMNNRKQKWLKVRNGKEFSNESVYELMDRVCKETVRYIENFILCVSQNQPLEKADYKVNYEGIKIY